MPTMEEMRKYTEKHKKEREEFEKKLRKMRIEELRKQGVEPLFDEDGNDLAPPQKQTWDHPNTMENSTATVLWIIAMIVSLIFKGGWALCILETIIWYKHITRHNEK